MQDTNSPMYGPMSFSIIWFLIALLFIVAIAAIVLIIIYVTRKKEIRTLSNVRIFEPHVIDFNALRAKYLALIDQSEQKFNAGQIKSSTCHQQLSVIVRLFFYEGMGFRADVMTLSDLKRTNYAKLANLIDQYYPDEFNTLEKGNVQKAAEAAREIVRNQ